MPRYHVTRDAGYPVLATLEDHIAVAKGDVKFHAFGEEFESDDPKDADAVKNGYLLICGETPRSGGTLADSTLMVDVSETHDASERALATSFTKEEKSTLKK